MINRRNFIKTSALTGIGLIAQPPPGHALSTPPGKRAGIIGLDTSHSIAFTKALNDSSALNTFKGYRIVAAYPFGSREIASSYSRIEGYTRQIKDMGVEVVDSIDSLLQKVDAVLLETNDGRLHLEQALPVLRAGKRIFIDKPISASLADALTIFSASRKYGVPLFSSSSLRYINGMDNVRAGGIGKVVGADTYSPATLEPSHPDLFWYGIHGVETLFAAMGTGCTSVTRIFTEDTDRVAGQWTDSRLGTFRGIRKGKSGYGGTVFGEQAILQLGPYSGYNPLLHEIVSFFETGTVPFPQQETIEILAFMEAAGQSRVKGGKPVSVEKIIERAQKISNRQLLKL